MSGKRRLVYTLTEEEEKELRRWASLPTGEKRMAERAMIVLMGADSALQTQDICKRTQSSPNRVCKWLGRFVRHGLTGLTDAPRSGAPICNGALVKQKLVETACQPPQGKTHWDQRGLANALGIGKSSVNRYLKALALKPHQYEMWLNSQDPEFEAKRNAIVGLYLNPPQGNALVISVDEKSAIQAKERLHPDKPMKPGHLLKREFEYVRHGTRSLFAALLVHQGRVIGKMSERRTKEDFLSFMRDLKSALPGQTLHVILDNLNTHKCKEFRDWLEEQKGTVVAHYTPTHASWLNQIECWFSILSRKVLIRGSFSSPQDLCQKIESFIEDYNQTSSPFKWTYTGEPLII